MILLWPLLWFVASYGVARGWDAYYGSVRRERYLATVERARPSAGWLDSPYRLLDEFDRTIAARPVDRAPTAAALPRLLAEFDRTVAARPVGYPPTVPSFPLSALSRNDRAQAIAVSGELSLPLSGRVFIGQKPAVPVPGDLFLHDPWAGRVVNLGDDPSRTLYANPADDR